MSHKMKSIYICRCQENSWIASSYSSSHEVSSTDINKLPELILGEYGLNSTIDSIEPIFTRVTPNSAIFYWEYKGGFNLRMPHSDNLTKNHVEIVNNVVKDDDDKDDDSGSDAGVGGLFD